MSKQEDPTDTQVAEPSVTSNMVAPGGLIRPGLTPTQHAIAQQLQTQSRYRLVKWRPRSGRTKGYRQWHNALKRIAEYLQVDLAHLDEQPPPLPEHATRYSQQHVQHRNDWLALNTILYDTVVPSLDLTGVDCTRDTELIDGWAQGQLADGRSVVKWAVAFADVTGLDQQAKIRTRIGNAKLPPGSTAAQLSSFMQELWELWKLDVNNSESAPFGYWQQVLIGMPTTPAGSHLVTLRSWLYGKAREFSKGGDDGMFLQDVNTAFDVILTEGTDAGLPRGDSTHSSETVALLDLSLGKDTEQIDTEQMNTSSGLKNLMADLLNISKGSAGGLKAHEEAIWAIFQQTDRFKQGNFGDKKKKKKKGAGGGGAGDEKKGDCNRCDSYFCTQANRAAGKYEGKPICILDKKSTFDIKTISNGGGRYVSLGRSWHESNPNAPTFKGVRFRVAPKGSTPSGESMNALGAEGTILVRELFGETCNACEASEWLNDADDDDGGCLLALAAAEPPVEFVVIAQGAEASPLTDQGVGRARANEGAPVADADAVELKSALEAAQHGLQQAEMDHVREIAALREQLKVAQEATEVLRAKGTPHRLWLGGVRGA